MRSDDESSLAIETVAVHGGEHRPGPEGSVVFPIYQGTVFSVAPGTSYDDIRYIRLSTTPSQAYLNDKLAALEGAEATVATSSGMAALTTILHAFLRQGDHLLHAERPGDREPAPRDREDHVGPEAVVRDGGRELACGDPESLPREDLAFLIHDAEP